jgi:hypothetical protein
MRSERGLSVDELERSLEAGAACWPAQRSNS